MAAELTADSTVVVAALSDWHVMQERCRRHFERIEWLPAHTIAESVAVLSRMPRGLAIPLHTATALVRKLCPTARQLRADRYFLTLSAIGAAGLGGGAVYDAIIGATAREHDATLLTLDHRAQRTYLAVGARFELLETTS